MIAPKVIFLCVVALHMAAGNINDVPNGAGPLIGEDRFAVSFNGFASGQAKKGCLAQISRSFGLARRADMLPDETLEKIMERDDMPWDLPLTFVGRGESADNVVRGLNAVCDGIAAISRDYTMTVSNHNFVGLRGAVAKARKMMQNFDMEINAAGNGKPKPTPSPTPSPPPATSSPTPSPTTSPPSPTPTPTPSPSPSPTPAPSPTPVQIGVQPVAASEYVPIGLRRIGAVYTDTATGKAMSLGASDITVAIIDTGIDLTNTDLNVVAGVDCTGSGTVQDANGHGTHVSGTVGAKNQGSGVLGVAPGTRVVAVRVMDASGSGSTASVACGLNWVAQNAAAWNIKVASMSLGGGGTQGACGSDAMHQAVCNAVAAGVTVVAAAGNSGADMTSFFPAAYPEVLAVTSITDRDGKGGSLPNAASCNGDAEDSASYFSNYVDVSATSLTSHMIAAPGACVYSTYLNQQIAPMSGTSMATPHVSGAVALCITNGGCKGLSPAAIINYMRTAASNHALASGVTGTLATDGFIGDPSNPSATPNKYYGYMAWAPY